MISDSQTRYGSARSPAGGRHGNFRRWRSYQASSSAGRSAGASVAVSFRAAPDRLIRPYSVVQAWRVSTETHRWDIVDYVEIIDHRSRAPIRAQPASWRNPARRVPQADGSGPERAGAGGSCSPSPDQ